MTEKQRDFPLLYTMILVASLLLTLFGARIYRAETAARTENENLRSAISYLVGRVQAADEAGGVQVSGNLIRLREGDSGYETRIYWDGTHLLEELSPAAEALSPDSAQIICPLSEFSVTRKGSLLEITAGGRMAMIEIHSEGGAVFAAQ